MKRGYFDQQCKKKSLTFLVLQENLQAHMKFGSESNDYCHFSPMTVTKVSINQFHYIKFRFRIIFLEFYKTTAVFSHERDQLTNGNLKSPSRDAVAVFTNLLQVLFEEVSPYKPVSDCADISYLNNHFPIQILFFLFLFYMFIFSFLFLFLFFFFRFCFFSSCFSFVLFFLSFDVSTFFFVFSDLSF